MTDSTVVIDEDTNSSGRAVHCRAPSCIYAAMYKPYLFIALLLAACGDNHATTPDAPPVVPTPDAAPDAKPCDMTNYPQHTRMTSVDLGAPFELALDGQGTRCEQIVRALTDPDPSKRPPELATFDVTGVTSTCIHDDVLDREIVRLRQANYMGQPLFAPAQDALIHVGHPANLLAQPATVVYLHADFLATGGPTANAACLDDGQLTSSVPGLSMTYAKFNACTYVGDGAYSLASDDVIELGDEGYLLDDNGDLRRVRAVDVYLLPSHLTDEITHSDAFCCADESLDHCVGKRLFIDVVTGELITEQQHCITC